MKKIYKMKAIANFYNPKTQKDVKKNEIVYVDGTQKKLFEEMKYAIEVKDDNKSIFL